MFINKMGRIKKQQQPSTSTVNVNIVEWRIFQVICRLKLHLLRCKKQFSLLWPHLHKIDPCICLDKYFVLLALYCKNCSCCDGHFKRSFLLRFITHTWHICEAPTTKTRIIEMLKHITCSCIDKNVPIQFKCIE